MEWRKAYSLGGSVLNAETPIVVTGNRFKASIEHLEPLELQTWKWADIMQGRPSVYRIVQTPGSAWALQAPPFFTTLVLLSLGRVIFWGMDFQVALMKAVGGVSSVSSIWPFCLLAPITRFGQAKQRCDAGHFVEQLPLPVSRWCGLMGSQSL